MHPIFRGARRLGLYILCWIPLALLLIFLTSPQPLSFAESIVIVTPACTIYAFVCLCAFYTCRTFPLEGARLMRNLGHHALHAVLGGAIWLLAARLVGSALSIPAARLNAALPLFFGFGVLLYLLSVAMHWAYLAIEASQLARGREADARLSASQAELRALKAQINPHFLYNSLNSISALTSLDPARARQMCIQLSEFLRQTLGLSDRDRVPLELELDLVRRYLAIEQTRFGSRLVIEEDVAAECLPDKIPALILQPLVENAIVHGIAGVVDNGLLRLTARHGNSSVLAITIENSFDADSPKKSSHGFGLTSIRRRLETEYGTRARLTVSTEDSRFRAELLLPVVEVGA
jgi:two-component system, LytTR family, sensor histidine kinase AlgZ